MNLALKDRLEQRKASGHYRSRQVQASDEGLLNFSSNDYLSLAKDKTLAQAYQKGFKIHPISSSGSMLLNGYHSIHQELERAFADFLGVEDALLFSSGYAANLAVIHLLHQLEQHCLIDKGLHASFYDGLKLNNMGFTRYLHQDLQDFERKLSSCPEQTIAITEGIFSMSGHISDLKRQGAICTAYHRQLLVDEAHSFGLMGDQGRGLVYHEKLTHQQVPLRIIPLGKAFAAQGAIVAGQGDWIEGLVQWGRSYVYSTGLSPAFAYGLLKTLDVLAQAEDRRNKLNALMDVFHHQKTLSSLHWSESHSAIQHLKLGCPQKAFAMSQQLLQKGILCLPVRAPTVSKKDTGLRVTLNYCHQAEDIVRLFTCLHELSHEDPLH